MKRNIGCLAGLSKEEYGVEATLNILAINVIDIHREVVGKYTFVDFDVRSQRDAVGGDVVVIGERQLTAMVMTASSAGTSKTTTR